MDPSEKEKSAQVEGASIENGAPTGQDTIRDDRMTLQAFLACLALVSQFCAYISTLLMPSTVLSYIIADLGDDNPNYPWITISWNVCASVLVTVGGRLSDIFGRRWFLIIACVVALCGAVVGATGKSVNQMIASGVLFGLGGGIQEMAYAALQEIVPMNKRVLAIGCFEAAGCFGLLSPIIAYSLMARSGTWRSIYWYIFAIESLGLILIILFYKPPNFHTKHLKDGKSRWELVRQMDFVGFCALLSGLHPLSHRCQLGRSAV